MTETLAQINSIEIRRALTRATLRNSIVNTPVQFAIAGFLLWAGFVTESRVAGMVAAMAAVIGIAGRSLMAVKYRNDRHLSEDQLTLIKTVFEVCVLITAMGWAITHIMLFPKMDSNERVTYVAAAVGSMAMSSFLTPMMGRSYKLFVGTHLVSFVLATLTIATNGAYTLAVVYVLLGMALLKASTGVVAAAVIVESTAMEGEQLREKHATEMRESLLNAQEAAAERERKASDSQRVFVGKVSHEIRTPLQVIVAVIETLEESKQLTEKARTRLLGASQTLLIEMEQLSAYVKNDYGDGPEVKSRCDLEKLVGDVVALHELNLEKKGLGLSVECAKQHVIVDIYALRQVVGNLISNAVKYTRMGEITVSCRVLTRGSGHVLRLEVIDTGIGMSAEDKERMCEPFYRGQAMEEAQGMGLGLSIVSTMVERMGGTLRIESSPGFGTMATLEVDVCLA